MPAGGAFIDDGRNGGSDNGAYADALPDDLFLPWIEDRDGECFRNIAFLNPDMAFECPLNPIQNQPNTGPAYLQHPTLASGCKAQPPEGTSGCGTTGLICGPRMAGNGENTTTDEGT